MVLRAKAKLLISYFTLTIEYEYILVLHNERHGARFAFMIDCTFIEVNDLVACAAFDQLSLVEN